MIHHSTIGIGYRALRVSSWRALISSSSDTYSRSFLREVRTKPDRISISITDTSFKQEIQRPDNTITEIRTTDEARHIDIPTHINLESQGVESLITPQTDDQTDSISPEEISPMDKTIKRRQLSVAGKLAALHRKLQPVTKEIQMYNKQKAMSEASKATMNLLMWIINSKIQVDDSTKEWDRFKSHKTLTTLPEIPQGFTEELFTEYIEKLCQVQTSTSHTSHIYLNTIEAIILEFVKSFKFTDVDTYNNMIYFLSSNYRIFSANIVSQTITKNSLTPNIETVNYLLAPMMTTRTFKNYAYIPQHISLISKYRLTPNKSTIYILLKILQSYDPQAFLRYLDLLQSGEILKRDDFQEEYLINKLTTANSLGKLEFQTMEIISELKTQNIKMSGAVVNEIVTNFLDFDAPDRAWNFISVNRDCIGVNMNTLYRFVEHFCKRQELYNAISIVNLFFTHGFLRSKPIKAYAIMAESMINYPDSKKWYLLVRYFVYNSKLTNLSGSKIKRQHLNQLERRAESKKTAYKIGKNEKPNLHSITRSELAEVEKIVEKLSWPKQPKFDLLSNHHEYITAALAIGSIPPASAI